MQQVILQNQLHVLDEQLRERMNALPHDRFQLQHCAGLCGAPQGPYQWLLMHLLDQVGLYS
jgi:hypothetical protein